MDSTFHRSVSWTPALIEYLEGTYPVLGPQDIRTASFLAAIVGV